METLTEPRNPVDQRIGRLNTASLRRPIEPDNALPWGTLGDGAVIPDELLSIEGLDVETTAEQRARLSREEVASMPWKELDRNRAEWLLPAARSKNGKGHLVPLSTEAIGELDAIAGSKGWPTSGLVFSTTGTTSVSGFTKAKRRLDSEANELMRGDTDGDEKDRIEHWRVHDLRRTMATGLQRLGIRFEVTEAVLNHISGARSGIAGVYQRYDWNDEKREAIKAWGAMVMRLVAEAEHVQNEQHLRRAP